MTLALVMEHGGAESELERTGRDNGRVLGTDKQRHPKTQTFRQTYCSVHACLPQKGGAAIVRRKSLCSLGGGETVIPLLSDNPETKQSPIATPQSHMF